MRGLIMTIGPEETSRRIVMLKLLMALEKEYPKGVRTQLVHRTLKVIKNNIDGAEEKGDIPALLRTRFVFESEAGTFPCLEELLQELAIYGIVGITRKDDAPFVEFKAGATEELSETGKRLCELAKDEELVLSQMAKSAAAIYKKFVAELAGCDC
jgi:hypothetical protein